jgi:hypothetical protein
MSPFPQLSAVQLEHLGQRHKGLEVNLVPDVEPYCSREVVWGYFTPQESKMKKISYVLAALATIAIAAPSIASAEDKPMMDKGMGMHHKMHHKMMHHKMMHHKKMMMKKDGM